MTETSNQLERLYELDDHPGRILPMEGLRGIAVLLVFLVHVSLFKPWVEPESAIYAAVGVGWQIGQTCVDLFFVLSGYLIYGAVIRRPIDYRRFLARRAQRIYPVFLVMFAVYVCLDLLLPDGRIPAEPLAAAGYLVANLALLPGLFPIVPLLTVAWSLSYEFFYYLTIPLLVGLLRVRTWRPRQRLWFFLAVTVVAFGISFAGTSTHVRLALFLAGVVVYEILNGLGWRPRRGWEWLAIAATAIALAAMRLFELAPDGGANVLGLNRPIADSARVLVLFVGFGLLCLVGFRARGPLYRCLSWTPLRWLGNMSYSFYLVHSLVLKTLELVLRKLLPEGAIPPVLFGAICLAGFVGAWVAATVLFALVERPFSLRPTRAKSVRQAAAH